MKLSYGYFVVFIIVLTFAKIKFAKDETNSWSGVRNIGEHRSGLWNLGEIKTKAKSPRRILYKALD